MMLKVGWKWLGALLALVWLFEAVTGSLLVYHFKLNDALISPKTSPVDFAAIERRMDEIEAAGGKANVNWIWSTAGLPGRFLMNYTAADGETRMARVAGDGSVLLDSPEGEPTFLETVRLLHLELFSGDAGERILSIAGIALLIALIHAFVTSLRSARASPAPVTKVDRWYQRLSLWGAIPAFVVVIAAVVVFFEHDIEGPIGAPPIHLTAIPQATGTLGFASVASAAEQALPGSRFVGTALGKPEDATHYVSVNRPGEWFRDDGYAGSLVIVNGNDGTIRETRTLEHATSPYKAIALPYPLHTGEIFGGVGRFLVLIVGLWLAAWSLLFIVRRLRPGA